MHRDRLLSEESIRRFVRQGYLLSVGPFDIEQLAQLVDALEGEAARAVDGSHRRGRPRSS